MSANRVLLDEPGPRGRRRIRILTVLSTLVIAALIAFAVQQFAANGQLAAEKWKPFTLPYAQEFLGDGLQRTLQITVVSGVLALPLGVVFALLRLSHRRTIRWIATSYIEVFRSLPLLLLILVFVLALPPLGVNPPIFWKVVIPIVTVQRGRARGDLPRRAQRRAEGSDRGGAGRRAHPGVKRSGKWCSRKPSG